MFVNGVERMGKSLTNTIILVVSVNKYLPSTFCLQSLGLELGAQGGHGRGRQQTFQLMVVSPSAQPAAWVLGDAQ